MNKYEDLRLFQLLSSLPNSSVSERTTTFSQADFRPELYNQFPYENEAHFDSSSHSDLPIYVSYLSQIQAIAKDAPKFNATMGTVESSQTKKDILEALDKALETKEISDDMHASLSQIAENQKYSEYRTFTTTLTTWLQLAKTPYSWNQGTVLKSPLPYRGINDHQNDRLIQEATIGIGAVSTRLYMYQRLYGADIEDGIMELHATKVILNVPYLWNNAEKQVSGSGSIRVEFLPDAKSVQLFFEKASIGGYPVFTGEYSVNVGHDLPQNLLPDEPSAYFNRVFSSEGHGKPLQFEHSEAFLTEFIDILSDYSASSLELAFLLLLKNSDLHID